MLGSKTALGNIHESLFKSLKRNPVLDKRKMKKTHSTETMKKFRIAILTDLSTKVLQVEVYQRNRI